MNIALYNCLLVLKFRTARCTHIIPLKRFVEAIFDVDLHYYSVKTCFKVLHCVIIKCKMSFCCLYSTC